MVSRRGRVAIIRTTANLSSIVGGGGDWGARENPFIAYMGEIRRDERTPPVDLTSAPAMRADDSTRGRTGKGKRRIRREYVHLLTSNNNCKLVTGYFFELLFVVYVMRCNNNFSFPASRRMTYIP